MCYEINASLPKSGYFLRVFELTNKFRHLAMKDKTKPKIVRQLSSCFIEKYSGFTIIEIEPLCYFSEDISKSYSFLHSKGKKGLSRTHKVYQCFYCNKFLLLKQDKKGTWKIAQENHVLFIILVINVLLLIKITFTIVKRNR